MGISLSTFSDGTAISASDLRARVGTIEDFVNEGIVQGDYDSTAWVNSQHIFGPDFLYPKHARFTSSDLHWRMTPDGRQNRSVHHDAAHLDHFVPVVGLGATVRIPANNTPIVISASFYAWEAGGGNGSTPIVVEASQAAQFALFVNGTEQTGTRRDIYASTSANAMMSRKQISIFWQGTIGVGIKEIQIKCRVEDTSGVPNDKWKHIWVETRSMFIDISNK